MRKHSKRRCTASGNKPKLHPAASHSVLCLIGFVLLSLFLVPFATGRAAVAPPLSVFGLLLTHLVGWSILSLYLWIDREAVTPLRRLAALLLLLLLFIVGSKPLAAVDPLLVPFPAFSLLVGIMFSPRLSIVLTAVMMFYVGAVAPVVYPAAIATILFVYCMLERIKLRSHVILVGILTGVLLFVMRLGDHLWHGLPLRWELLYPLLSGLLSSVLAVGVMPLFESSFSLLTPLRLLELSNPNKPLLKRLLMEAPGTYHHSILVGNLAETAAHSIGANEILTRVAAYYHDVGKLERPFYFKENQFNQPNPHDTMPPVLSAQYIRSHMTYGLQLLQSARMPKEIVELIASHHGTSLIKYFYHKEKSQNPSADIADFVYPGPKPRSREAVILMLADSVEAAVRSELPDSIEAVRVLIERIVEQKIAENQLSDSMMTFSELETVKKAFVDIVSGTFHQRVAYPEVDLEGVEKSVFDEISSVRKEKG